MRLKYILLTLFLASSNLIFSQFLHTPEELEEIVNNNPDKYLLQETMDLSEEGFENCRAGTEKHNVQSVSMSNPEILTQELNKSSIKKLKKKNKKIIKKAGKSPDDNKTILELASNHFRLGNFDEALYYKLKLPPAEIANFSDAYFLAKSYLETKRGKLAFEHAFQAKVLLPYHANMDNIEQDMVEDLLTKSLAVQKKLYKNWTLQFSYCITTRENKTYISFNSEPWKTYGICKSIWQEDSNHKAKMATISDQPSWLVEEKECLLNTLVAYMRHETNNPEFDGLRDLATALDEDTVKEFILYEKFIAQYQPIPSGAPSKSEIEKIKDYFLSSHAGSLK